MFHSAAGSDASIEMHPFGAQDSEESAAPYTPQQSMEYTTPSYIKYSVLSSSASSPLASPIPVPLDSAESTSNERFLESESTEQASRSDDAFLQKVPLADPFVAVHVEKDGQRKEESTEIFEWTGKGDHIVGDNSLKGSILPVLSLLLQVNLHTLIYAAIMIGITVYKAWWVWLNVTFETLPLNAGQSWGWWVDASVNHIFVIGWPLYFMIVLYRFKKNKWLWIIALPVLLIWSWGYDFVFYYFKIIVSWQSYPHYAIYVLMAVICGLITAKTQNKPFLRLNYILPVAIVPCLMIPYDAFLLRWFWALPTDWLKILARCLLHPLYMEVLAFTMRFFSRRLPENPHLTFIMAFQVQAISSYYGRLTLSGVQSDQLEWLCSAILGAQEFLMRVSVGKRDQLLYRLFMKKEEIDKLFQSSTAKILNGSLCCSEMIIENTAIFVCPLMVYFYRVPNNGQYVSIQSTMTNIFAQLAIEVAVDFCVLLLERHHGVTAVETWKHRANGYILILFLACLNLLLFFTNGFVLFVSVQKGIAPRARPH